MPTQGWITDHGAFVRRSNRSAGNFRAGVLGIVFVIIIIIIIIIIV